MAALTVGRTEAGKRIRERIAKGEELLGHELRSEQDLEAARAAYYTWTEYNTELLRTLFATEDEAKNYEHSAG